MAPREGQTSNARASGPQRLFRRLRCPPISKCIVKACHCLPCHVAKAMATFHSWEAFYGRLRAYDGEYILSGKEARLAFRPPVKTVQSTSEVDKIKPPSLRLRQGSYPCGGLPISANADTGHSRRVVLLPTCII